MKRELVPEPFDITRRQFVKTTAAAAMVSTAGFFGPQTASAADGDQKKKRRWIDTHIHVSDIGRDGKKREKMLEDLLDVLDRCDADLRFAICPDAGYVSRMTTDPAAMMVGNQMVYDLCRRSSGRLYGCCMVNPNFLDESLKVMKTCFEEWGFVQLGEMLTYIHKYKMSDKATEKVVQLAAKYNVPVEVHLGTYWHKKAGSSGDGMNHLTDLLAIAERVPEAKYILAHAIGCGPTPDYVSWADMFLDTIKGVFPKYPDNFWFEIRDFQCKALPRTIREVPTTRLLSGTDWTTRIGPPFQNYGTMFDIKEGANPFPPKVSSFVDFLLKAGASEADITRIGYENARELYKLPA
ncbi:MAG: TatD family hydrolase [Kiritimatiellae bacterium]|nr:TatD family hydrolase [Kiritimatiellia bacterium]MDD5521754.1 TatD family hydrolase [Kiritimatiellia bacterium]